ncbi:helix-turn-helix transcriptional regulator [Enterobacter asburiae]|uniref:helix-turn-helix domain-containing protein n=1 Tax=unclassified Scandinavium TaxID=2830652 RepID=UPI00289E2112|nr:helix-turn-helix transcriptional regulator [Scandinavium sp.]
MKNMTHTVSPLLNNVTIVSNDYFYKYGLRKMITLVEPPPDNSSSTWHRNSPADITFRKSVVSINYHLKPSPPAKHRHSTPFSIDIPFNCDSLTINEVQAKLEKILSLARLPLSEENKKDIFQKIGGRRYLQLSAMENQVLHNLGKGYCAQDIAAILGCTDKTVSTHCRNAMRKMGITKKSELYHYASWMVQHIDSERITLCL